MSLWTMRYQDLGAIVTTSDVGDITDMSNVLAHEFTHAGIGDYSHGLKEGTTGGADPTNPASGDESEALLKEFGKL